MSIRRPTGAAGAFLAVAVLLVASPRGAHSAADPTRVGFPSSDPVDGKFLSMPGKGLSSLSVPTHLSIGVPASQSLATLTVEIFDGDIGAKWDKPGGATTTYELYTDPNRDGSGMTLVASKDSSLFSDDAWGTLYTGAQVASAQMPSGNYFYRVIVSIVGDAGVLNAYKVAVNAPAQVSAIQNEFSVIGGVVQTGRAAGSPPYAQVMTSTDPMPTLNPLSLNPLNTYDGTFTFKIYVGSSGASVSLQEGDADHMTDATAAVPAEAALPPVPGVAADGADGNVLGGVNVDYRPFKVGGPIKYRIVAPNASVLATVTDPSGDAEYETVPTFDTTQVGYYRMEWTDVDMRNTLFVKPAFGVEVFSADSAPVGAPLATGLGGLRGTMFHDTNGNGILDPRESGLPGVAVTVTNLNTLVETTVLTNAYGEYAAGVPAGPYRADVATGSPVEDKLGTTIAGPTPVVTVVNAQTVPAVSTGIVDPTGGDPSLALVPECHGTLSSIGFDVELPADLRGQLIQVQYTRPGTSSLYDAVSFVFNAQGRFSTPVLGFSRNLKVVNCYYDAGATHVVVEDSASSRGAVRRFLRPGNVAVLTGPAGANTGVLRPICRPSYITQGQVFGGESTVKSLR